MPEPKVSFERVYCGPEAPRPWRAHIITENSDHHGEAATPHEALLYAASHWCRYADPDLLIVPPEPSDAP